MKEKEPKSDIIISDPSTGFLVGIKVITGDKNNGALFFADQMKSIGNDPIFSDFIDRQTQELLEKGKRITDYLNAIAFMRFVINVNVKGGFPWLSDASLSSKDLRTSNHEAQNPNLMQWVNRDSKTYSINEQATVKRGYMSTFALAYKQLSPVSAKSFTQRPKCSSRKCSLLLSAP